MMLSRRLRPYVAICKNMCRHESSMSAICKEINKPLDYGEWQIGPTPAGHVKIKIAGAGINFGDILQCQGKYQEKREPPFVPGMECSGTVLEVGAGVEKIEVGDRVICFGQGVFSSHAIIAAPSVVSLPRSLPPSVDLAEASALLVSYGTAHMALTSSGRAKAGETVLITAASGGVGLACVELAR
jgi:NADPH:quinone reductase